MAKETGKETANSARDREMALFKFSLIAPVVAGTFTQTTKMDYYKETCSREHLLPGGKAVKLSPLTLKKWYWLYTSGGLEALLPKTRSDLGESRVLSVDACRQIEAYLKLFSHITGRKIYEKLVEEKTMNPCFVTHVAKDLIPLAKLNRENPDVVDVYELVINGQEISPGYSELNDPDVQKERL